MAAARIVIRADASLAIGSGHVVRCISLAHALRARHAQVSFVTRSLGLEAQEAVRAHGFDCAVLPSVRDEAIDDTRVPHARWAGVGWQSDAAQTVAALDGRRMDWVIVDHYAFDARWHEFVASRLGCALAAIDDLADRDLAVDLLVDHNLSDDHRLKYDGRLPARSVLLGGPRYALLGPSYAAARRYAFHEEVRSIGIFMGGSDAANLSLLALQACRLAGFDGTVEIALTRRHPHFAALQAAASESGGSTRLSVDLADLSGFFARHDLQIGAGGGATWERCCIGVPTLAVVAADNQRHVLLPLARAGAVRAVESVPTTLDDLAAAVRPMVADADQRRRLSQQAMSLVDGSGAARAAEFLLDTRR
ncbi:MAG: UDP-N-acetylglucosamine--N-acetylmuramyl-(pentapeptide) pyrophosphoryl-undecaprenol N-acetylglucosamine transferase [Burkholderiaceae bacterium]|nr:UDP-N-acetylglucosamine--N-acetylmuramyl-(pentapeptide) pyrophosphoryl-undecaprenol N-acetylglucosamine transferase [Burkholderiaceae bacterium]